MQISIARICAFIILIAVILVFVGPTASVFASSQENTEKSCCDECNKSNGQGTDHCSTPDCPMFLCLSVNTVSPFMPLNLSGSVHLPQFAEKLDLKSSANSIFHPPIIG